MSRSNWWVPLAAGYWCQCGFRRLVRRRKTLAGQSPASGARNYDPTVANRDGEAVVAFAADGLNRRRDPRGSAATSWLKRRIPSIAGLLFAGSITAPSRTTLSKTSRLPLRESLSDRAEIVRIMHIVAIRQR